MKLTAIIASLFIVLFISCKEERIAEDFTGYKEASFSVAALDAAQSWSDTMATIMLKIPAHLDTFYRWHDQSDCASCGRLKYRFADKRYSLLAESGFYYELVPDSILQLTFIHDPMKVGPEEKKLPPFTASDSTHLINYLIHQSTFCDSNQVFRKEFFKIDGRPFLLVAFQSSCSIVTKGATVSAAVITPLDKMMLFGLAETNRRDTLGFVDEMFRSFRSINIK